MAIIRIFLAPQEILAAYIPKAVLHEHFQYGYHSDLLSPVTETGT